MTKQQIDESRQREIFELIVRLQDEGLDVQESRQRVAAQESLSLEEIKEIERMGLINQWPPLD